MPNNTVTLRFWTSAGTKTTLHEISRTIDRGGNRCGVTLNGLFFPGWTTCAGFYFTQVKPVLEACGVKITQEAIPSEFWEAESLKGE